ncbi:MAG: DUF4304 domain-containing protein [Tepidisphaeraceae bacterium]
MAQFKDRLILVEQAVHGVLSPLGFKKQKTNWRRSRPETLQQFTIASQQLGARYRPEWGLNLVSRSENPRPVHHELHVQWVLEQFLCPFVVERADDWTTGKVTGPLDEMLEMMHAFHLKREMPGAERQRLVVKLLTQYVVPCFDMYQTEESVRRMMGCYKAPLRAQMFGGCPKDWWPKD